MMNDALPPTSMLKLFRVSPRSEFACIPITGEKSCERKIDGQECIVAYFRAEVGRVLTCWPCHHAVIRRAQNWKFPNAISHNRVSGAGLQTTVFPAANLWS